MSAKRFYDVIVEVQVVNEMFFHLEKFQNINVTVCFIETRNAQRGVDNDSQTTPGERTRDFCWR